MANEDAIPRVGNVGTIVEMSMKELVGSSLGNLNLSTTSALQIEFKLPNGLLQTVTSAVKNSPGSDGIMTFTDSAGAVFNSSNAQMGTWEARGVVNYSSGNTFKGSWAGFQVGE